MDESPYGALAAALIGFFASLHPYAATGAVFGCCAVQYFAPAMPITKRFLLLLFSFGFGYSLGIAWDEGEHRFGMAVAFCGSFFVSGLLPSLHHMMQNGGQLPPWLESLLDRLPSFKRGK